MMINEILLTARLMLVAMSCTFVIGLPVILLFLKRTRISLTSEQVWAVAPFVGVGVIIFVSQNLLYLDVRSIYSAMVLWVFGLLTWSKVMSSSDLRALLNPVPWMLLSLSALVYLIHGSGLLALGASNYYGYGWVDMYNSVCLSQFFMDHPFSSVLGDHAFLKVAQHLKTDRIGAHVLSSFIGASGGADAQQAYGTTILLSPFLIFFALYFLISHLGVKNRIACLAALGGALSPAVCSVHLECFMPQAMAMPFLILLPMAVSSLITKPGLRSAFVSAVLFALIAAIYTELVVPLLAIVLVGVFVCRNPWTSAPLHKPSIFGVLGFTCVSMIAALAINPGFFKGIISIVQRTNTADVLGCLYPWAFKAEGLARLWIGNQAPLPTGWIVTGLAVISVGFILFGLGWLGNRIIKARSITAFFVGVVVCFPLAPIFTSVLSKNRYPYQSYKLLLMMWPLILCCGLCGVFQLASQRLGDRVSLWIATTLVIVNLLVVNKMAYASAKTETVAKSGRGGAHLLIDADFIRMRKYLAALEGKRIFLWWYDTALYEGGWRSGWLAYFARRNNIWEMNPILPSGVRLPLQIIPENVKSDTEIIGITWKEMPIKLKAKVGAAFWIYSLLSEDLKLVDSESRITISRTLKLSVKQEMDQAVWYPVWVAGKPGNATLITVKRSSEGYQFRYDHWGYPVTYLEPRCPCTGKDIILDLKIMQFDNRIRITCNEAVAEGTIPGTAGCLLERDLPVRFGDNRGISLLEGKYPLAPRFPGSITELSRKE